MPLPSPVVMTLSPRRFAGVDHRVAAVLGDVAFWALGEDFREFLLRVRLAAAGVDGFSIKSSYSCMVCSFPPAGGFSFSIPRNQKNLQMGRMHNLKGAC